jgi:hypothetical protein
MMRQVISLLFEEPRLLVPRIGLVDYSYFISLGIARIT